MPFGAAASVLYMRSPLTRIGRSLASGAGHLVVLDAGRMRFRDADAVLDAPRLLWIAEGAGREVLAEPGARGAIVMVPHLAQAQALPATLLGEQMRRTLSQDLSIAWDSDTRLGAVIAGLDEERRRDEPGAELAAGHYLSLLLVALWRIARADLVAHGRAPQGLAERFVVLVGQRLRDHMQVADYARALEVSRDRLGSAVRRATGLSPQGYIHQQLIREASELLANTGMPVSQVAFRLGFADAAYFTRFFQRHRGDGPLTFRRKAKERRAEGDVSYAAWP